ncbi:D-arabinono-1,4-lactone oxidase [Sorangium sp. So ce260]|uniref:D-arabinono-1,4-lactone oxidase n=1 Tax=Sorangium sp. So ce260 TaxID=3133291 RepID=UPI003F5EDC50
MDQTISIGEDGYFHPESEEQIQEAVRSALQSVPPRQIRVRGSAHSVAKAIYTDDTSATGAPPQGGINVLLDRFRAIGPIIPVEGDPDHAIVEVEGGCNLGKDPYDLNGISTWENSLNYALQQAGWALDDLGGISHQTVSGFLSTGSSGGSLTYSIDDNIVGFNLIDGTGKLWVLNRDDPDPEKLDMFFAAGVSMGLLGIISKVRLRVRRSFNISGRQDTSAVTDARIDLFGNGSDGIPSLEKFLRETEYTRLMWWPQYGFERVQVWQAKRIDPAPGFTPIPYVEIDPLASLAGSLFYTIIGNLDDISEAPGKLFHWLEHLDALLDGQSDVNACSRSTTETTSARKITKEDVLAYLRDHLREALARRSESLARRGESLADAEHTRALLGSIEHEDAGSIQDTIACIITLLVAALLQGTLTSQQAQILADFLKLEMPFLIGTVLGAFVTDGCVPATPPFQDTWMCGLPMDNQMDDQLWPTWFTELWIPVEKTAEVMQALKKHYAGQLNEPLTAYCNTGAFSCELYAAKKSDFWMSPSYGADVFRVDVFWFALNGGDKDAFYKPFWEDVLKPFGFRPHWGKFLPPASPDWVEYYRQNFPRMDDFLVLRAKLDPQQIFVTDYWRENLGINR